MSKNDSRNYGIDLLRIICMLSVVILHILGHGGVLQIASSPIGFSTTWLWEILAYPAVNCFVMISGLVGYRGDRYYPKLRNIISLFFTVLFYSVTLCIIFKLIYPQEVGILSIIKAVLPVTTEQYWFFTSYFAMFLISPMLNLFVCKANSRMLTIISLLVLLLSIPSTLLDPFRFDGGYSFVWFALLYILGAAMKKTDVLNKISSGKAALLAAGAFIVTWASKLTLHFMPAPLSKAENILISYCSPTILVMAAALLCIFAKIKVGKGASNIISFFAPAAFSVYLIHDNIFVRKFLISKNFTFINGFDPLVMSLLIIACALGIFLVCSLIDKLRELLFNLLHLKQLSEKAEGAIKGILNKALAHIFAK